MSVTLNGTTVGEYTADLLPQLVPLMVTVIFLAVTIAIIRSIKR
jgi:hypothetical protein